MINKTSLSFVLGFVAIIGLSLVLIMGTSILNQGDTAAQVYEEGEKGE